jgi:uncharacterized membrane protein
VTALTTVATVLQVIGLVLLLMGVTNVRKRAVKIVRDVGDV